MPSTCFLSAASMASENNLPNAPKSDSAIASTPANGPRPTTLIHTSAQISVSTPRMESKKRRTGKRSKPDGMTLRAASRLNGSAKTAAMVVPSSAIDRVSPSAERLAGNDEPGSGGIIISVIQPSWLSPEINFDGEKSRSTRPNTKIAKAPIIIAGIASRDDAGRSNTSGYFARSCSESGFGNWLMRGLPCRTAGCASNPCRYR